MNENNARRKNAGLIKIIIPVIIIAAVFSIWAIKNAKEDHSSTQPENQDFALNANETFDLERLKSYGLPILIDFGADFCQPCRDLAPIIDELNKELQGRAIIKYVDVQKYPEITDKYPINAIPTQLFFDSKGNPYNPGESNPYSMKLYNDKDTGEHILTKHEGGLTKEQLISVLTAMGMKQ